MSKELYGTNPPAELYKSRTKYTDNSIFREQIVMTELKGFMIPERRNPPSCSTFTQGLSLRINVDLQQALEVIGGF